MAEAVEVGNASPHPAIPERSAEAAIGEAALFTEPKPGQVRMRVTTTGAQVIVQRRDGVAVQPDDPFPSAFTKDADGPLA